MRSKLLAMGAAASSGLISLAVRRSHARLRSLPDAYQGQAILGFDGDVRYVESSDGARIKVIEAGASDGPLTVLVHGFVSTAAAWGLVGRRLIEAGHRVVALEQRGHGDSAIGRSGHHLPSLGDDLAAVIQSLDDRPITLVGHSMGTVSAFALALRHPRILDDRVEHFVGASALYRGRGKPLALELKKHVLYTQAYDWARRQRPLGIVCTKGALGPHAGFTATEAVYDMYLEAGPAVIEHFGRELLTFDFTHALPAFKVPTTLLVGSADNRTPPSISRDIARRLPAATMLELPNIGHMTPVEAPEAIADAVLAAR